MCARDQSIAGSDSRSATRSSGRSPQAAGPSRNGLRCRRRTRPASYVVSRLSLLVVGALVLLSCACTEAGAADLTGLWYGTWETVDFPSFTSNCSLYIEQADGYAIVNAPEQGLFYQPLPAAVVGDDLTIWAGDLVLTGSAAGDSLSGTCWYYGFPVADWQASRYTGEPVLPGPAPGPSCGGLPPLFCVGDADECTELLPFDPDTGPGYLDALMYLETWDNQFRSYVRRDVMQLVKYATAKVQCKTADWDYGNFAPLGLGDMSEADGAMPGTSIGAPAHPPGTHENGNDIDIAYYQLYATDNLPRPVGVHYLGETDVYHCVEEPYALDRWRTALFVSYLSEHPHVRVIGVDGQVGLVLEEALDELVELGWIDPEHRAGIPLAYEVTDEGLGWFQFHHDHLHVSMRPILPILSSVVLEPETLNRNSEGKYLTGYIELVEGYDVGETDIATVALIVDGHTLIPAVPAHSEVSDHDGNGIPDLAVKFDRQRVSAAIGEGTVEVALTGAVDGQFFQGVDTITVHK
jgi:hypothetical protein